MPKKPEIPAVTTLAKTRLFHAQAIDLRFSNGVETQYERLKSGSAGAVLVVPMLDDDTVLLIREYVVGMERYELALPKGRIEPGEELLTAANREMMEEVRYGGRDLQHLKSVSLAPGSMTHLTHIVLKDRKSNRLCISIPPFQDPGQSLAAR
jgi:ADP-ribose diphosphatase